jgi:hypothetical protein
MESGQTDVSNANWLDIASRLTARRTPRERADAADERPHPRTVIDTSIRSGVSTTGALDMHESGSVTSWVVVRRHSRTYNAIARKSMMAWT